jgi:hypothetical protein
MIACRAHLLFVCGAGRGWHGGPRWPFIRVGYLGAHSGNVRPFHTREDEQKHSWPYSVNRWTQSGEGKDQWLAAQPINTASCWR